MNLTKATNKGNKYYPSRGRLGHVLPGKAVGFLILLRREVLEASCSFLLSLSLVLKLHCCQFMLVNNWQTQSILMLNYEQYFACKVSLSGKAAWSSGWKMNFQDGRSLPPGLNKVTLRNSSRFSLILYTHTYILAHTSLDSQPETWHTAFQTLVYVSSQHTGKYIICACT